MFRTARGGCIVTMRILTIFTAQAPILLAASAFPVSTPFPYKGLSECVETCENIRDAANNCLPPTAPVSNEATYISCFLSVAVAPRCKERQGHLPTRVRRKRREGDAEDLQ